MPLLGGIRPPLAVLVILLLLVCAITALELGRVYAEDVPNAVLLSQRQTAEDGATALRAALEESSSDLRREAATFNAGATPSDPGDKLDMLGTVYQKWRGTAIIDVNTGELLAARGENVPLSSLNLRDLPQGLPPRVVTTKSGVTRLLVFALLDSDGSGRKLLVASDSLALPAITVSGDRVVQVLTGDGTALASEGPSATSAAARALAQRAARHTAGDKPAKTAGGFTGVSGDLLGPAGHGTRTVAGYAAVAADAGGAGDAAGGQLGLTVLTTLDVKVTPGVVNHRLFALIAAGALLVLAAAVTLVLSRTLQRPLLRLHLEARRLARGDLGRPVEQLRFGEPAFISTTLESLRRQLLGGTASAGRAVVRRQQDRIGVRTVVVVCVVVLLAWSAPLLLLLNRPDAHTPIPAQLVADQRDRTESSASRVRQGLNEGYADLASIATAIGKDTSHATIRRMLTTTLAEHDRYRSLYVVDGKGHVVVRTGGAPWTPIDARSRDGVGLVDRSRKVPVLTARVNADRSTHMTVVGEFDIAFLNGILSRPGMGTVWLVDKNNKVIASSVGYRAFESLPDRRAGDVARSAESSSVGTLLRSGELRLAAASPILARGQARTFSSWHVVSVRPASWLHLAQFDAQRRTMLAGLLGLAAAATCLGWLHIVVVRPLRALGERADALAGGDRKTVLFPAHHDEVGSVVRSLELIRQQLAGPSRGGASASSGPRPPSVPGQRPSPDGHRATVTDG